MSTEPHVIQLPALAPEPPTNVITELTVRQQRLSVKQVARFTGMSVRSVWRLTSAGLFPKPVRVPGIRRTWWRSRDVAEWLERTAQAS